MSGQIAAAAFSAGLSILGGMAQNAAIKRQADENWNNSLLTLGLTRDIDFNNLLVKGDEVNRATGAELSSLAYEEKKQLANTVVQTTERNIYGATAARLQGQVEMEGAMMADAIVQKGEAAMTDVQMGLSNANYAYNTGVYQASIQRQNMYNQRKSSFEMLSGAVGAGASGASGYNSMMGA